MSYLFCHSENSITRNPLRGFRKRIEEVSELIN
jgi:hypothetical protein